MESDAQFAEYTYRDGPVKVLLTSSGRRNYLIEYFKEACAFADVEVLAADSDPTAPTLAEADRCFIVPKLDDPSYVASVESIIQSNGIDLVVPLHDQDITKLSSIRSQLDKQDVSLLTPNQDNPLYADTNQLTETALQQGLTMNL